MFNGAGEEKFLARRATDSVSYETDDKGYIEPKSNSNQEKYRPECRSVSQCDTKFWVRRGVTSRTRTPPLRLPLAKGEIQRGCRRVASLAYDIRVLALAAGRVVGAIGDDLRLAGSLAGEFVDVGMVPRI